MNTQSEPQHHGDYIMHTFIGDQRIIPFDTFNIQENEYSLLKIIKSTDDIIFLKLVVVEGPNFGNRYIIPKQEFENKTLEEVESALEDYQH